MRRPIDEVRAFRDQLTVAIEQAEAAGNEFIELDEQAEAQYQAALADLDAAIFEAEKKS
jgi:ABC-type Zn uptake system ZnuABC Zn-binding protein ZnuA